MNVKPNAIIIAILIILSSTIILTPQPAKAEPPEIDEQQTNKPCSETIGSPPCTIYIISQGFKPDKRHITKLEIYIASGGGTITAGIGHTTPYPPTYWNWVETVTKNDLTTGWNTFEFTDCTLTPNLQYYIKIIYEGSTGQAGIGYDNQNPYSKGQMSDNVNGDRPDDDLAFKLWGYSTNERPETPTLDSPTDGKTYTVEPGNTKDITLKATTTDPENDQIKYRFYDATNDNIIGTTDWLNSGDQGSKTWDNLGPGTYSWYTKAKDNEGYGQKSTTYSLTIEEEQAGNNPPNTPSKPSGPSSGETGERLTYSTSAIDPDGDTLTYRYNWDDGSTSNWGDATRTHTYNNEGPYTIKAQAKDQNGEKSIWSNGKTVTIQNDQSGNQPPTKPEFPSGSPPGGIEDIAFYFYTTSTDSNGDIIQYHFDWGDGEIGDWTGLYESNRVIRDYHIWEKPGTYEVKAQAKDEHGAFSEWSDPVTFQVLAFDPNFINNPPETPTILVSDDENDYITNVGEKITLEAVSIDTDGDEIQYLWDINDDDVFDACTLFYEPGNKKSIDLRWYEPGDYNVKVKAVDQFYDESDWSDKISVSVNAVEENRGPEKPSMPGSAVESGYAHDTYSFNTWTYDPDGDDLYYKWSWGDGTESDWLGPYDNGFTCTAHHSWNSEDWYTIKVKSCDDPNGDGDISDGEITRWTTRTATFHVKGTRDSTIFYPDAVNENLRYDWGRFEQYIGWLSNQPYPPFEDEAPYVVNHQTGVLGTFAFAGGNLPTLISSIGDSWTETCIRKDFYLGREKEIEIEAEILYTGATAKYVSGHIPDYVSNYKVYHLDEFSEDTKVRKKIDFDVNVDENIIWGMIEAAAATYGFGQYLKGMLHTPSYDPYFPPLAQQYYNLFYRYEEVYTQLENAKPRSQVLCEILRAFGPTSQVLLNAGLIIMLLLYINHLGYYPSFGDVDQHMKNLQDDELAKLITINMEKTKLKKGDHKIWVGLESKVLTPLWGSGMAYATGLVRNIKITGISPPNKPTITASETGISKSDYKIKLNTIDYNDDPIHYEIEWGDGQTTTTGEEYASGETATITHKYTSEGTYTLTITAIDCDLMESETVSYITTMIEDAEPPYIEITRPLQGVYFYDEQIITNIPNKPVIIGDITIKADASDNYEIDKVIFEHEDGKTKTDQTIPYSWYCTQPNLGFCNFYATAYDLANNADTDSIRVLYSNLGHHQNSMTTTLTTQASQEENTMEKRTITSKPVEFTETQIQNGIDNLRDQLSDEFPDFTITYTYTVDYGDRSPVETFEKQYPILTIDHEYPDDQEYTITITLTTTLTIDGQTYTHTETIDADSENNQEKTMRFQILQRLFHRFPMLEKLFQKFFV